MHECICPVCVCLNVSVKVTTRNVNTCTFTCVCILHYVYQIVVRMYECMYARMRAFIQVYGAYSVITMFVWDVMPKSLTCFKCSKHNTQH